MTTTMNCEKPDSQMCLPTNGRPVHTASSVQPGYYNRYTTPSLFKCWTVVWRDGYLWDLIYFFTTCISTVPWFWCTNQSPQGAGGGASHNYSTVQCNAKHKS